jgi:hypothetical protein
VGKRRQRAASATEPASKKVRRELTPAVSVQATVSPGAGEPSIAAASLPVDVPTGTGALREEDIAEEESPLVRAPRSRSRDRGTTEEGEIADEPPIGDEDIEVDIMSGGDVEIPGISAQPESAGSPSVFVSSPREVDPSPTTGVFKGKAPVVELPRVGLSSSSSGEESSSSYSGESEFEDEVDYGDEPTLPDPGKFSHISEEEMYGCEPLTTPPLAVITPAEGTFSTFWLDLHFRR